MRTLTCPGNIFLRSVLSIQDGAWSYHWHTRHVEWRPCRWESSLSHRTMRISGLAASSLRVQHRRRWSAPLGCRRTLEHAPHSWRTLQRNAKATYVHPRPWLSPLDGFYRIERKRRIETLCLTSGMLQTVWWHQDPWICRASTCSVPGPAWKLCHCAEPQGPWS